LAKTNARGLSAVAEHLVSLNYSVTEMKLTFVLAVCW